MLGLDAKRNATVIVESTEVSLLVLEKVQFYKLVEDGEVDSQVLTKMWNEKRIREESNQHQQLLIQQLVAGQKKHASFVRVTVNLERKTEENEKEVDRNKHPKEEDEDEDASTTTKQTSKDFSFA